MPPQPGTPACVEKLDGRNVRYLVAVSGVVVVVATVAVPEQTPPVPLLIVADVGADA